MTSTRKLTLSISQTTSSKNSDSESAKSAPTLTKNSKRISLVEDLGMRHAYIKCGTPQLNSKVERSQEEFYQLLTYKDDVDLNAKLREWESFYNLSRPHDAVKGKTPYKAPSEKL